MTSWPRPSSPPPCTWGGWKWTGSFTTVDLIAATSNVLNGALLARQGRYLLIRGRSG